MSGFVGFRRVQVLFRVVSIAFAVVLSFFLHTSRLDFPGTITQTASSSLHREAATQRQSQIQLNHAHATSGQTREQLSTASDLRTKCINGVRQIHNEKLGSFIKKINLHRTLHDGHLNVLIQPAFHENLGDTLLTNAEQLFFKRQNFSYQMCLHRASWPERNISHCHTHFGQPKNREARNLAFWHAGGNWGDLWTYPQGLRMSDIEPLLKNNFTLVTMPQSLFYRSNATRDRDARQMRQSVMQGLGLSELKPEHMRNIHDRLTFTWRERASYDIAKELYPFARNMIVPDIAFQLGEFQPKRPRKDLLVDILLFLRRDMESNLEEPLRQNLQMGITMMIKDGGENKTFQIVDWDSRKSLFGEKDHFDVPSGIELLALGKVAIVDRLHAGILSYLSGLHFIYIDNVYGKLTKTLTTAFEGREECALWERADNLFDAVQKALVYLEKIS
jgi:exopolysaccharide biosynthesis predicted pyruvyltransferase EpsI